MNRNATGWRCHYVRATARLANRQDVTLSRTQTDGKSPIVTSEWLAHKIGDGLKALSGPRQLATLGKLSLCLLLTLVVGCQSDQGIIRGQSANGSGLRRMSRSLLGQRAAYRPVSFQGPPAYGYAPQDGHTPQAVPPCGPQSAIPQDPSHAPAASTPMNQSIPAYSDNGGAYCPKGSLGNSYGGVSTWWRPTHHHTYSYRPPKNLVYPPENQPAAIVQYPYYTVKGPTDFFYK